MKWILKNAILHPVTAEAFRGSLLIDKGKIAQINPPERKGTQTFDANGHHLFPGIVEEHCHIGTHGEKTNQTADQDTNEWSEPITPEMQALDGIKIFDFGFRMALANGITTLNIFPGSGSPITGVGVALKNDPSLRFEERILIKESGLKMAVGENPKSVHSKTSKTIQTRMATAALIRKAFQDALNYEKKKDKEYNRRMEVLLKVLKGELTAHVHVHRADDIQTIIRIADEFGFKIHLEHATEAHLIPKIIVERQIPVAVGPMFTAKYKIEVNNRSLQTPAILERAGVKDLSLITDHPVIPIWNLPIEASMAVHYGLSEDLALRAITINPAKNLGLDHRIGSLEVGKDADMILLDRELLDPTHRVLYVWTNGNLSYDTEKEGMVL